MTSPQAKTIVVGLYGVPGAGKSFLLHELKHSPIAAQVEFFEGSEVIDKITPGGLETFKALPETASLGSTKMSIRELAITRIRDQVARENRLAVVAGHFMFWPKEDSVGTRVITNKDREVYTHIIYLATPPETVVERRNTDRSRHRPPASAEHIRRWQQAEITELKELCSQSGILFVKVQGNILDPVSARVQQLLSFFLKRPEDHLGAIEAKLSTIISPNEEKATLRTMLVFDADKTLAPEDTGALFWKLPHHETHNASALGASDPLTKIFRGPLQYSQLAFCQAALLYAEQADILEVDFDECCEAVASLVHMRPGMLALLSMAAGHPCAAAVIVTCGLRQVWELVLERVGLAGKIQVIGSGHAFDCDAIPVTPEMKAHILRCLRDKGLTTWAFGDGTVDIPMLAEANNAIVVVGDTLSTSMNKALQNPIPNIRQVLFYPRIHQERVLYKVENHPIPVVDISSPDFLREVFPPGDVQHRIHHATSLSASKILATPMRDARVSGHALRAAHHRVGWYLSMTFLSDMLGAEETEGIPHVQGNKTVGHRLRDESSTLIVALMRGGEPMALGVSEAFPAAGFLHGKVPGDVTKEHLEGVKTVVFVDSVVNSGKTMVEFVERVRGVAGTVVRIVVVAGVVQAEVLGEKTRFGTLVVKDEMVDLVALRMSGNKFTGKGGTDTGNRLFNTTRLA